METHPSLNSYLKAAKWEVKNRDRSAARAIFEKTLEDLGQGALNQYYFIDFCKFEIKNKEYDRVREIFKFGLENIPRDKARKLHENYLSFEK